MKKLSLLLTLLALLCLLTPAMVRGEAFNSGDFKCTLLEDGSAEIKKYSGKASVLEIPAQLDGCAVTSIAKQAFTYCNSLTQVIIPEGVTAIGAEAFYNCNFLTQITLPDSVVSIDSNPFVKCFSLTDILVSPNSPAFEVIDGVLFDKAEKALICYPYALTASGYEIPQGTLVIGNYAFSPCKSLTQISLPDSVTSIGRSAFDLCTSLSEISLSSSLATIGVHAFFDCDALTQITIPDGVTSIEDGAFYSCDALSEVAIPVSVTSIGADAFGDYPLLTLTVFPGSFAETFAQENGIPCKYAN